MIGLHQWLRLYIGHLIALGVFGVGLFVLFLYHHLLLTGLGLIYLSVLALGIAAALFAAYLSINRLHHSIIAINSALISLKEGYPALQEPTHTLQQVQPFRQAYTELCAALEHRQRELVSQQRRTALLTRLSIELRESLEPQRIMQDVLAVLVSNTEADSASMILLRTNGEIELAGTYSKGQFAPFPKAEARQVMERGLGGWVLRHARSVVLGDIARDERWLETSTGFPEGSAIAIPLTHGRSSFGVLTLQHREHDRFRSPDLIMMESVASQVVMALNAAQRHAEERRYREQALLLFSMSQFLTLRRSSSALATELLEKSAAVFEPYSSALFLAEHTSDRLALFAGRSNAQAAEQAHLIEPQMATAADRAWRSREAVTQTLHDSSGVDLGMSCIGLPLLHNGVAIGAFTLVEHAKGGAVLSARMWSMLTIFANVVAAAFSNVRLIEQLHIRAEELELLVSQRTLQLKRSRDMLRVVFDHLPDGLVLMDKQSTILAANSVFCRNVLGLRPQSVIARRYQEVLAEQQRTAYIYFDQQIISPTTRRLACTDMVGQQRWYHVERYTIIPPDSTEEQMIERWHDMTEQEELNRRLLQHEQLRALGKIAASITHEIGNPLQSVQSCLDLCLEDQLISPGIAEYLDMANDELNRIRLLLERLRDLYRQPHIGWENIDINNLVLHIRQITARQLQRHNVILEADLAERLPVVRAQPEALRQVVLNLVLNAQDAMPHGGTIRITTYTKQEMSCLRLSDTGSGISAERLQKIFEPFQAEQGPRTGLGLYLSKHVIEQHCGAMNIASTVGSGTTVTVSLPWSKHDDDQNNHTDC